MQWISLRFQLVANQICSSPVSEAIQRCMKIAQEEGTNRLDRRHLEQILAQLMLDF
jgi:hypothetical protein